MDQESLAAQFRGHFGHRQHLYGVLLDHLADDLEAGGPTAEICRGHLDAPRADVVQLRLLAGLYRIVLRGDAPGLLRFYPALGGAADPEGAWPAVRPVLAAHAEELRTALDLPPQTNEPGRAACLAVGTFEAVRRTGLRRIRLLELGASAGVNLLVDRFTVIGPGWRSGPADSPLVLDTKAAGVAPEAYEIVERRGCDLDPVDAADPEGARYLTSFVWPFHLDRHRRLTAALEIARQHPVVVDRAGASAWLEPQLAEDGDDDVLTVVWQSITEQYWPAEESVAVREIVAEAAARRPVVRVTMEGVPPRSSTPGVSLVDGGPDLSVDGDVIARSMYHGPPITLV